MPGIRATKVGSLRRGIEREGVGISNLIRAVAETSRVAQVGRHNCRDSFTTLGSRDSPYFPTAKKPVGDAICAPQPALPSSYRKLVEIADGETVAQIRSDGTMLK